ncbi:hypothetical protein K461DRAFT_271614 [Myriangium duriaei CBS 260.36]|uniref:Uncharacterized protein n=1 Tax=Myriangium duriaei CBS 260.36 TaxID=1168546 RepID=A0A9P4IY98_9PEZI|nr:hypothetical protein K461DRAFT_271614 [Myriangium duriaei CBS 260.36]
MSIPDIKTFTSSANASHWVQYRQLNPGAPHTLVFYYGAGGSSVVITLFRSFANTHSNVSILCIDRWTQYSDVGKSTHAHTAAAQPGPSRLSDFSAITVELLDSLNIQVFSVAAHSAGIYPLLGLIRQCGAEGRIRHAFPLCTHIPAAYTASKAMSAMCTMPDFLFNTVTKMDSLPTNPMLRRLVLRFVGSDKNERLHQKEFVDTPECRSLHQQYRPDTDQAALDAERFFLDYRLVYCRLPEVNGDFLLKLYKEMEVHPEVKVTWFTSDKDAFFGPASVRRLFDDVDNPQVEVVNVASATHADIYVRSDVWDRMYRELMQ